MGHNTGDLWARWHFQGEDDIVALEYQFHWGIKGLVTPREVVSVADHNSMVADAGVSQAEFDVTASGSLLWYAFATLSSADRVTARAMVRAWFERFPTF